ncbi:hypothetical protein JOC34_000327 [Virgibacillus halotolerans]|uniref:hypothetical protein n=1 Tax=Virgibacillus halotolerans TaxID=1071053 RepID=UPI001960C88F|nr:hypothetical protein [Virgibacillus halotolerans]MBM7597970.1 hypothetical protein [Virgibacillus halotolerans]
MKKQLSFITNQHGFFLSYVLFITSLIFILTMSNIAIYRNDLQITANQIDQVKIESLFQMGRTKFKEELDKYNKQKDIVSYAFPDGTVDILIDDIHGNQYELYFTILTKEQQSKYNITNTLQVNNDID